jgi:predicted DNA binding CopG/RHH family protein
MSDAEAEWGCALDGRFYKMLNMALRSIARVRVRQTNRTRFIGLRIRAADADQLKALAKKEGVGLSTYARLILEQYITRYGKRSR